jgi:phospholipid/cholesterol/gamma-HCH transport system permease protein
VISDTRERVAGRDGVVAGILGWASDRKGELVALVDFLGPTLVGLFRLLRDRGPEGRAAFARAFERYGLDSLPIVGLIAFTGGVVLTLLGLKELGKVGVEGVAPRLVGIVLREISPLIVGVALAGRVASSMAAEAAVGRGAAAPRILALLLAGPLLVAYAGAFALAGSAAYAVLSLERPTGPHLAEVWSGFHMRNAVASLVKGAGFGFVVGLAGAWHGLRAVGAPDVGSRVRAAVVSAVIGVGVTEVLVIFVFKWIRS